MADHGEATPFSATPEAAQPPPPPEGAQRPVSTEVKPAPPEATQWPARPEAAQWLPPPEAQPAPPPFADWVLAEMQRRGWRQADFARSTGVDVSMISRWLHGRRPDPASLERVAIALGVDLDALLTLAGYRSPTPRDEDPRVATLVAKMRQVNWTTERFLIIDALLDDLRRRSPRVPAEQVPLPGWEGLEGDRVMD